MQRTLNHLLESLALVIILMLMIVISRWVITTAPETAWVFVTPTPTVPPSASPTTTPTHTPTPTATPTRTPSPTPTHTPTLTPTPAHTYTPSPMARPAGSVSAPHITLTPAALAPNPLPIPEPMPTVQQSSDVINILVLGSDQTATGSVGRTDVIVVASVDPELPSVALLSIPRDFYAWIPNQGFDKINTVYNHGLRNEYPGGGAALLKETIEYNLGIPIDYYVLAGFDGFVHIVDTLGGVSVAVECPLSDTFPDPGAETGQTDVDWMPGIHHLDGKHALWYVRSRWNTGDFDRNRRQQQVLRSLYGQILTMDVIPKITQLWEVLNENVSTDIPLNELLYLANIGARLDAMNVKSRFVGRHVLQSWTAPNGGYVLVPYYEALGPMVAEALAPPASGRAQQRAFRVEVWNGTAYEGLGHVAAERLRWEGFEVVSVGPADSAYERTQVVDLGASAKGSAIYRVMRLYGRYGDDFVSQPTEGSAADFRVILGADYDPCFATKIYWGTDSLPTPTPLPAVPPTAAPTPTP